MGLSAGWGALPELGSVRWAPGATWFPWALCAAASPRPPRRKPERGAASLSPAAIFRLTRGGHDLEGTRPPRPRQPRPGGRGPGRYRRREQPWAGQRAQPWARQRAHEWTACGDAGSVAPGRPLASIPACSAPCFSSGAEERSCHLRMNSSPWYFLGHFWVLLLRGGGGQCTARSAQRRVEPQQD